MAKYILKSKHVLKSKVYVTWLNRSSSQTFMSDGKIYPQVKRLCQMAKYIPKSNILCQMAKYILKSNIYVRWLNISSSQMLNISSSQMFMPDG